MTHNQILIRIKKIVGELLDMGYNESEIDSFWNEVFKECGINRQLKIEL